MNGFLYDRLCDFVYFFIYLVTHEGQTAVCQSLKLLVCRFSTFVTRAFYVAEPRVWNSLPDHLHDPAVDPNKLGKT